MATSSRDRVRAHRERQRADGLRPIQKWVPDVRSPRFRRQARRQSGVLAQEWASDSAGTRVLGEPPSPPVWEPEPELVPVRRGEVWTASGGVYASKPRPVVVIQDDAFGEIGSVTVCPMTTRQVAASHVRIPVEPVGGNGLERRSFVMVDKITTTGREKVHTRLGVLSAEEMSQVERALLVFLGIAR